MTSLPIQGYKASEVVYELPANGGDVLLLRHQLP